MPKPVYIHVKAKHPKQIADSPVGQQPVIGRDAFHRQGHGSLLAASR